MSFFSVYVMYGPEDLHASSSQCAVCSETVRGDQKHAVLEVRGEDLKYLVHERCGRSATGIEEL